MPEIDSYLGLSFYIYYFDNKKHQLPHIHVRYAKYELVIALETSELLEGFLPRKQRKLAEQRVKKYRSQLMLMWKKAIKGQYIGKLEDIC